MVSSIGFFGKLKNFLKSHLFWEWELPSTRGNEDFWDSLERRDGFLRSCTLPVLGGWVGMLWSRKSGKNVWMSQKYLSWKLVSLLGNEI